jgi:formylglycine-generating enzyme required for sulfatase activity
MIGNLFEWTDEWYASPPASASPPNAAPWPTSGVSGSYQGDYTWGITSYAYTASSYVAGAPAAALRGGCWSDGAAAGLFALSLGSAPSYWGTPLGLRCVLPSR